MWRTSFGGVSDFGLGSAIAVFLFILVIPVLLLNISRFRREAYWRPPLSQLAPCDALQPVASRRPRSHP
jgi:hypothetical protein